MLFSGDTTTKLTLSGWSYQEGANPSGGNYGLQVGLINIDGTTDWRFANELSKSMQGWQHLSVEIEPTKPFQAIDVYMTYYNQTGAAWYDALRLEVGTSHTSYFYEARNNYIRAIEDPLRNTINYSHDFFGNRTQHIEANGNTNTYVYNEENELISVKDAREFTTSYQYDGEGNLTEVTNARGNKQKYEYNEQNSLVKVINPLNRSTVFEYDRFGNQTRRVNADTSTVSSVYDNVNRLVSISYNNVKQFDLEYDSNDNLTKVTQTSGPVTSFSYDANNRLLSLVESGKTTAYSNDNNSNITGLTIQGGSKTSFLYNKLNLMHSIMRNNANVAYYIYNESSQVSSVQFINGTYTSSQYNGANQLVEVTNYHSNGTVMDRFRYTYSNNGNIIGVQLINGSITYRYDRMNQLLEESLLDGTLITYQYDSVGNRTKKTTTKDGNVLITNYTYNSANQLITENNQTIQYDLNGNMVDNGEMLYIYNPDNRLIEVKVKATKTTLASFTYDYQGRRKSMTTANGTVFFHYDQRDNVIFETNTSGTILVEYTWDNEKRPVTMIRGGLMYYYHLNGHGDVIALTDKDGNIVASYSYDAWGNILSLSGLMSSVNPYRFAGYRFDQETGIYYLMARYYNPNLGRFITRDTFEGIQRDPLSLNQYAYTENNPVMMIDPSGNYSILGWSWNSIKSMARVFNLALIAFGGLLGRAAQLTAKQIAKEKLKNELAKGVSRVVTKSLSKLTTRATAQRIASVLLKYINTILTLTVDWSLGYTIAYVIDRLIEPLYGHHKKDFLFQ